MIFSLPPRREDAQSILRLLAEWSVFFGQSDFIRDAAEQIIAAEDVPNNGHREAALALLDFVKNHVRYLNDPVGVEHVMIPVAMLRRIEHKGFVYGDCDDHVLLYNSLLISLGIEARPLAVKLFREDIYDHVITQFRIHGRTFEADPCTKQGEQPKYKGRMV